MEINKYQEQYLMEGYTVIEDVFDSQEIELILSEIASANTDNPAFRINNDVFAIRQFLKLIPEAIQHIF